MDQTAKPKAGSVSWKGMLAVFVAAIMLLMMASPIISATQPEQPAALDSELQEFGFEPLPLTLSESTPPSTGFTPNRNSAVGNGEMKGLQQRISEREIQISQINPDLGSRVHPELMTLQSAPSPSTSAISYYLDRPTFDAAYPGLLVEDFENANIAPGNVGSFGAPLDSTTSNFYFNPGDILPGIQFSNGPVPSLDGIAILGAGFAGNPSINIVANMFVDNFEIIFTTNDVHAVGMDLVSYFAGDTLDIQIYGPGNVLLDTTTATSSNIGTFWGLQSTDYITRIVIDSPTDQAEGVDNVAFGLPAPHAFTLTPMDNMEYGIAGGHVDHPFTITNTGSNADSYDLSASGNTWPVEFWSNPIHTLVDERFEGVFPPLGWVDMDYNSWGDPWGSWHRNDYTGYPNWAGSGQCAEVNSDAMSWGWTSSGGVSAGLQTPHFSLSGSYASATLEFDMNYLDEFWGSDDYAEVWLNAGGSWYLLDYYDEDRPGFGASEHMTLDLTPFLGEADVFVEFYYWDNNEWCYWWQIDNVKIHANTGETPALINSLGPLSPGQSAHFNARVHIPGDALPGDFDLAVVGATSQGDASIFHTSLIETRVPESIPFFDDMESGPGNWVADDDGWTAWDLGDPIFGVGPWDTPSGANCWGTNLWDDYDDDADISLTYGPLDTSAYLVGVELSFMSWYYSEGWWDAGFVEVSTDGEIWDVIQPKSGPEYWNTMWGPDGYTGWYGDDWEEAIFSLDDYTGGLLWFRFRFRSDGSVTYPGWYIDDVSVSVPPPYQFESEPWFQLGIGWIGDYVDHPITITNTGAQPDAYRLFCERGMFIWPTEIWNTANTMEISHSELLQPGETFTFNARVRIPRNVNSGDLDVGIIGIESVGDNFNTQFVYVITLTSLEVPFYDNFESGEFGSGPYTWEDWTTDNPDLAGVNDWTSYSGWYSMYTHGGPVSITSAPLYMEGLDSAIVSFVLRRGSWGFSEYPDWGEDLVVEYFSSRNRWVELDRFYGGGTAGQVYTPLYILEQDALHPAFRLRFRQTDGSGEGYDYWHIDDVYIGPAFPDFTLTPAAVLDFTGPGEWISYDFQIVNNAPHSDMFELSVEGNNWNVYYPAITDPVLPLGGSFDFTVWVEVPEGAVPGEIDTFTLTATSLLDPWATQTSTVTTGVARVHNLDQDTWFFNIQPAVDEANPGDDILAFPGLYEECVTIDKPLYLMGMDIDTTIVDGMGGGSGGATTDWIGYNDGHTENSLGLTAGGDITIAIELTDTELASYRGKFINELYVSIGSDDFGFYSVNYDIWIETTLPDYGDVYTSGVNIVASGTSSGTGWDTLPIPSYAIPSTGSVVIGINFMGTLSGQYPCGMDTSTPGPTPRANYITYNGFGTWSDLPSVWAPSVWGLDVGISGGSSVFTVLSDSVSIAGFTVQNAPAGILLDGVMDCEIYGNVVRNCGDGIVLENSGANQIYDNMVQENNGAGVRVIGNHPSYPFGHEFFDDFSTNTGDWTYHGSASRTGGYAQVCPIGGGWGHVRFTEPIHTQFIIDFNWRIWDGGGADGLAFMFYKDMAYAPIGGGDLGFGTTTGYGIEFDQWIGGTDPGYRHIALIQNNANNHLVHVADPVRSDAWRHAEVRVDPVAGTVEVYLDHNAAPAISWSGVLDTTFGGFGFTAATGGVHDNHRVDNVRIQYGSYIGNEIHGNEIIGNTVGILLEGTENNLIHHNQIIDNTLQAYDDMGPNNQWDDGVQGNYWSDYTDRYPLAIAMGEIWSTPYDIDVGAQDLYPLVGNYQPTGEGGGSTPTDTESEPAPAESGGGEVTAAPIPEVPNTAVSPEPIPTQEPEIIQEDQPADALADWQLEEAVPPSEDVTTAASGPIPAEQASTLSTGLGYGPLVAITLISMMVACAVWIFRKKR